MKDAILPILYTSTGSAGVDEIVRAVVGIFELAFAGRVRSYYVEGSYADGTEVATSDVDMTIVFREQFADDAERARAAQVARHCASLSRVELDVEVMDEAKLAEGVYPSLKLGSLCLYGDDRREQLQLLPIDEWTRQRIHIAYWLIVNIFNRPPIVTYPLAYPDPTDELYGYTRRTVRLPAGEEVDSTRDLIRVTGWAATALIALRAGVYVSRKSECHKAYRRYIGDEWSDLLEDIYRRCRTEWGYLVPEDMDGRGALRAICERTLRFENHFLRTYKDFVVGELREDNVAAQRHALWVLGQIAYQDEDIRRAVQAFAGSANQEPRQAAIAILARFR